MGASFTKQDPHYVFSRQPPPDSVPPGVEFVTQPIGDFANRVRKTAGKNLWLMGGGGIIGSFLDEGAIDEFIVSVMPTFIGDGIPLMAAGIAMSDSACVPFGVSPTVWCNFTTTFRDKESDASSRATLW